MVRAIRALHSATCVFMFLSALSLCVFVIAGVLIIDETPLQLSSSV